MRYQTTGEELEQHLAKSDELSPAVAPMIEGWFRAAAGEYEDDAGYRLMRMQNTGGAHDVWQVSPSAAKALVLARVLLDEEVTYG